MTLVEFAFTFGAITGVCAGFILGMYAAEMRHDPEED